jgi:hypothetical protein
MNTKVLGYVVAETKTGKVGTAIYLQKEHDDYRKNNAKKCEGFSCREEYLSGDWSDRLKIGQSVQLIYDVGYQGKAIVRDIIPSDIKQSCH